MKDLFQTISEWTNNQQQFTIATVIKTWGSSPRPVGSTMIINENSEMAGSVSGGCVEGAVVKAALPLIGKGTGQYLDFGITDDDAWAVGLSCGGKIKVYAERFMAFDPREEEQSVWKGLKDCLKQNKPCVLLTHLVEGQGKHFLIYPDGQHEGGTIASTLLTNGKRAYSERKNQIFELEGQQYFAQVFPRKSQMLIIGAAHITVDLVELAHLFGFETIVIDPRGTFSNKTQFTVQPDQIFEQYPIEVLPSFEMDAYTYAVVLSHDPKIDDNALEFLLNADVAYIGALGSRRTHAKRVKRLSEAGFSNELIEKIHAPIGMDINAKTPREIALSIMGEIVKVKNTFL